MFLAWAAVLMWLAGIFYLSSLTGPQVARINVFRIWDKAAHFVAFGVGAGLLHWALACSTPWTWRQVAFSSVLGLSVFGALDEWHQLYTPKRSGADPADWAADTLGAIVAVLLMRFVSRRLQAKAPAIPPSE